MKALKSRTVWTAIVLLLVNGVPAVADANLVPADWLPAINSILTILAAYFRVKPRVQF